MPAIADSVTQNSTSLQSSHAEYISQQKTKKKIQLSILIAITVFIAAIAVYFNIANRTTKLITDRDQIKKALSLTQSDLPQQFKAEPAVCAGEYYTLVLHEDGHVTAHGENLYGQVNIPKGLSEVVKISAGAFHNLALKKDGTVVAWGYNNDHQCEVPAGISGIKDVAAGYYYSFAVKNDGTVINWRTLHDGMYKCQIPKDLTGVKKMVVSKSPVNNALVMAIKEDGTVTAWSYTYNGRCEMLVLPESFRDITDAVIEYRTIIAIKKDGKLVGWGGNSNGQLDFPEGLNDVKEVSMGEFHSIALKKDGTVLAWGNKGSTGMTPGFAPGYVQNTVVPQNANNVISIAAGRYHSVAMKSDGTCVAWGSNTEGQCNVK